MFPALCNTLRSNFSKRKEKSNKTWSGSSFFNIAHFFFWKAIKCLCVTKKKLLLLLLWIVAFNDLSNLLVFLFFLFWVFVCFDPSSLTHTHWQEMNRMHSKTNVYFIVFESLFFSYPYIRILILMIRTSPVIFISFNSQFSVSFFFIFNLDISVSESS